MAKGSPSPQNGEVPVFPPDAAAPSRQRPEEILASTLTVAPHPEATDGWSARGRRIFLIAMAAAGVILVVVGLLVTNKLAPGAGTPAPVQTGPNGGLTDQLLRSGSEEAPPTPAASTPLALPLPSTPTTAAAKAGAPSTAPVTPAVPAPSANTSAPGATPAPAPSSSPLPTPTTTIPCAGLLGQTIQQAQIPIPCSASGALLGSGAR
jgi:hypothetical protein